MTEFQPFPKIARLTRNCVITEKLDGSNASVYIGEDGVFLVGSRNRWLTPEADNFGFALWAYANKDALMGLGVGHHFGEWWGEGIQRRYGIPGKRFSLFNVARWGDDAVRPVCCGVVPTLYSGLFTTAAVDQALYDLRLNGSRAAPGFMKPEGIVVWHEAARVLFKKTIEKDEEPKGAQR